MKTNKGFSCSLNKVLRIWKNFSLFLSSSWYMEESRRRWNGARTIYLFMFRQETRGWKRFICLCAYQRKGRAEGKQVCEKKVTCSECQFCDRALVYLLSPCIFSIILWFWTFSWEKCVAELHFLSMCVCCILWNLTRRVCAVFRIVLNNGRICYFENQDHFVNTCSSSTTICHVV